MKSPFEFATAGRVLFGGGQIRDVGKIARSFGRICLVVTGRNPERAGPAMAALGDQGIVTVPFPVPGEPDVETIRAGTASARGERCEFVVGFGGGSALDTGKAIAAMLANDGDVLDYLEIIGSGKALTVPSKRYIAIPTTAGTGSEVTRNAVLASPGHRLKVSLRSPFMLPTLAIVDPELTHGLPPSLTATTGLDALTQLIEPFVCTRANPVTDAICREGVPRAARSLRKAFREGTDSGAREDMALCAVLGGMALANAGLGAVHGLAGPLGGIISAPHGALCAALLPQVMEMNVRALRRRQPGSEALRRYDELAKWLTAAANATADEAVNWVRELVSDLKISKLGRHGFSTGQMAETLEKAAAASSMKANPISLTREELAEILEKSM